MRQNLQPDRHVLRLIGRAPRALSERFFDRPALDVARALLGCTLVRRLRGRVVLAGRIVEVEAYDGPRDRASHASRGRTPRNAPMFGAAGRAYVYLVYGMHCCLNVVTGPPGYPAAILLRAVEPFPPDDPEEAHDGASRRLASGPGRLTRAFDIDRRHDRSALCREGPLYLAAPADGRAVAPREVVSGPRIGVDYAGAWARRRFRFGLRGSAALSRPFPGRSS